MTKACSICREVKDSSMFHRNRQHKDGLQSRCKACVSEYQARPEVKARRQEVGARWHTENRDYRIAKQRQRAFPGLDFDALLASQGGKCLICSTTEPSGGSGSGWHVDHDHSCCPGSRGTCGKCIRGILCGKCNMALGLFEDSAERLMSAASYLMSFENVLEVRDGAR